MQISEFEVNFQFPKLILGIQNQFCGHLVDFSTPGKFSGTVKYFKGISPIFVEFGEFADIEISYPEVHTTPKLGPELFSEN